MKFLDVQHPFFIPVWRRVVVVAVCLGWAGFELSNGFVFWAILFGSVGIYCFYQLFIVFDPPAAATPPGTADTDPTRSPKPEQKD